MASRTFAQPLTTFSSAVGLTLTGISFKEGDTVTVTSGSFEGFTGVVDKLDIEEQTADVRVSMFGRETTVSLPLTQIKAEG